jgi:hypothetical protein
MFSKVSFYDEKPNVEQPYVHEGPLPKVFFDMEQNGTDLGRIEMELYADVVPKVHLPLHFFFS